MTEKYLGRPNILRSIHVESGGHESTYAPLRASLYRFYPGELFSINADGKPVLYKGADYEFRADRFREGRFPQQLYIKSDEKIKAVPAMEKQFEKHIKESKDVDEVKGLIVDWVEETFDEVTRGEAVLVKGLKSIIGVMIEKYDDFLPFAEALPNYDYSTAIHSVNCMAYVINYYLTHGVRPATDELINEALTAVFHDIGKQKIDKSLILKPGKLTDDEYKIVQTHARLGYETLLELRKKNDNITADVLDGALHHHERINGTGYPDGIKGDEISELTELVGMVDVFDAVTIDVREYRKKLKPYEAIKECIVPDVKNGKFRFETYEKFIKSIGFKNASAFMV